MQYGELQTATDTLVDLTDFLQTLWPDGVPGRLLLWTAEDRRSHWPESLDAGRSLAQGLSGKGHNVYFGVGLRNSRLGPSQRGGGESIVAIPGAWIDIDVLGPAHAEQRLPPTIEAAAQFVGSSSLPPTLVVNSGHGLHAYWLFREPWTLDSDAERASAAHLVQSFQQTLRSKALKMGWHLDNTADLARILRLPGTVNRKSGCEPIEVRMTQCHPERQYNLSDFEPYLLDQGEVPLERWTNGTSQDLDSVVSGCAWLRHCRDDAATLPEPEWYAALGIVARTDGGERAAHEWSRSYPRYSQTETEDKILHAIEAAGPRTCRAICEDLNGERFCRQCTHYGQITSPIAVGRMTVEQKNARGDRGHSLVLAGLWRDRYRWAIHRKTWMRWTGSVWRPADDAQVVAAASDALRVEYARQLQWARGRDQTERLTSCITQAGALARVQAALAFLRGEPGFGTEPAEWDAASWHLNCANGILDLANAQLHPHDPRALHTKMAPVSYEANAQGVAWEAHLRRFLPDPNVRRELQRHMGQAMVGANLDELLPIWYGTGGNGKSTTAAVFQAILGEYAQRASPDVLVLSKHERHPTELAELAGARWVMSVEIKAGARLDEGRVKDLTGGDRLRARFLFCDSFEFPQTWTLALLVNHRPVITGTDPAIWRRVRLIPWTAQISPDERRPQAEVISELLADGNAILVWMVRGLQDWQLNHWWVAPEVRAASDAYRHEQDRLGGFLFDVCETGPHCTSPVSELYDAYTTWCEANGEEPLGKRAFGTNLRDRGINQGRGAKGIRQWVGIRLQVTKGDRLSEPLQEFQTPKRLTESLSPNVTQAADGRPEHPCWACGATAWWQRPDGGWVCGRCHPKPGSPAEANEEWAASV